MNRHELKNRITPIKFCRWLIVLVLAGLLVASWRHPHFWQTAAQRGDSLLRQKKFAAAAKTYTDPWRIGVAQYRNGDFVTAAKTFARVPGAVGAFDQGNAWLMRGNYDAAIESYDRALSFHAGWQEAMDNKALAAARKAKMEASSKDRDQEQLENPGDDEMTPDAFAYDQKGEPPSAQPVTMNGAAMSEEQWRATWLRRVQTTPSDFLRMKFSYQAAHLAPSQPEGKK